MSTDDGAPAPRTRAELRAARAEAERAEAAAAAGQRLEVPPAVAEDAAEQENAESAPPADQEAAAGTPPGSGSEASAAAQGDPAPPRNVRGHRRFRIALFAVLAVLALAVAGLSAVSLTQGPRLSSVQVDPSEAIETSGSRVILTANEALTAIDASQVSVDPAVPFTVDASGRGIGVRFTVPLDDETTYTVRVQDVTGVGGGPSGTIETSFTTPASEIFVLARSSDGQDQILRSDLTGERATAVFAADHINDFRATDTRLVVTTQNDDGTESHIIVMDRDGGNQRELPLPGEGRVSTVQVSERGGLVGYLYSDLDLTATTGRASVLVTQSLSGDGDPQVTQVAGADASVFDWQFVPDSAAVLFIDFDGSLMLDDLSGDAGPQAMGTAAAINGISRGTYTAVIEKVDSSVVELDLTDGSETPLQDPEGDFGPSTTSSITPYPGGTLRHTVSRDDAGLPTGQSVLRVADDGTATSLLSVSGTSAILQACASPSGQYAAILVAPQLTDYDTLLLPLPEDLQTHLIDLRTGEEMVTIGGFDVSWCQLAPAF